MLTMSVVVRASNEVDDRLLRLIPEGNENAELRVADINTNLELFDGLVRNVARMQVLSSANAEIFVGMQKNIVAVVDMGKEAVASVEFLRDFAVGEVRKEEMQSLFDVAVELDLSNEVSDVAAFLKHEVIPSVRTLVKSESVLTSARVVDTVGAE